MKSLLILLVLSGTAAAQVSDVEVPSIVVETGETSTGPSQDEAIDLANIVQSAAKNLTTVQEAPAIVTVVTADEIKDRQYAHLDDLADTVPGWQRVGLAHSNFEVVTVRGQVQAVQFLHDGLSLFDPMVNIHTINRNQPMELIKRVEMITGPGGVLWGSNSLLGIMNVITKDAEDIEGVEVGSSIGNAPGDRLMARAYVMAGKSNLLHGKLKLFAHGSFETYQGAEYKNPLLLFHEPLPFPNSPNVYGPLTSTNEMQSMIVNLDGKATMGKLQVRAFIPFGKNYKPMGLSGDPVAKDLPEDSRCPQGSVDQDGNFDPTKVDQTCVDNLRTSRANRFDYYDRYVVAEYKDRFANGKAGITMRAYAQEFVRGFYPLQVLAPSDTIRGGLSFHTAMNSYRIGGAFDGDFEIAKPLRVLYGAEAFNEWKQDDVTRGVQGPGNQAIFQAPYDLTRLPVPCPRLYNPTTGKLDPIPGCPLTFDAPADRSVLGAYVSPQLRPSKKVILDGGARLQVAPEAGGSVSYPVTFTGAGTLVWNFIPNWHLKLNYAQGFRPPVFNNTSGSGEGVVIAGNKNLKVETDDATQAEINARIFKGNRRIRELSFRIDGSYTRMQNFISVTTGSYKNSADRAMASGEFLGKLYLQGGHRIELGYTWLQVVTADRGVLRDVPENWFNFATVFNLVTNKLTATTNLKVMGSTEDPNRLVEYRDSSYMPDGTVPANETVTTGPSDVVLDKLPPIMDLSLGVTWTPVQKLLVRATVYNLLNQHAYQPDVYFDYEPHLEYLPNPYEGIRAYVSALYQY